MVADNNDHVSMTVWCTLIPPEELDRFSENEDDLRNISEAYDDWLVSMRSKTFVGADVGIMLDRIRILMINIGIACAMNRPLAEEVQSVVSDYLRARALALVKELPESTADNVAAKEALEPFFQNLRFTRDIFPEEDLRKLIPANLSRPEASSKSRLKRPVKSKKKAIGINQEETLQMTLLESSNIMKKLYMRLLSPDPWGTY